MTGPQAARATSMALNRMAEKHAKLSTMSSSSSLELALSVLEDPNATDAMKATAKATIREMVREPEREALKPVLLDPMRFPCTKCGLAEAHANGLCMRCHPAYASALPQTGVEEGE